MPFFKHRTTGMEVVLLVGTGVGELVRALGNIVGELVGTGIGELLGDGIGK